MITIRRDLTYDDPDNDYTNLKTNKDYARFCDWLLCGHIDNSLNTPSDYWIYDNYQAIKDSIKSKHLNTFIYMIQFVKCGTNIKRYVMMYGTMPMLRHMIDNTKNTITQYDIINYYYTHNKEIAKYIYTQQFYQINKFEKLLQYNVHTKYNFTYMSVYIPLFNNIYTVLTLDQVTNFAKNYQNSPGHFMLNDIYNGSQIDRSSAYENDRADLIKIFDEHDCGQPLTGEIYNNLTFLQYIIGPNIMEYIVNEDILNYEEIQFFAYASKIFCDENANDLVELLLSNCDFLESDMLNIIDKSNNEDHIDMYNEYIENMFGPIV